MQMNSTETIFKTTDVMGHMVWVFSIYPKYLKFLQPVFYLFQKVLRVSTLKMDGHL